MTYYFYECGICDCLHPCGYQGDCRDDLHRHFADELDAKYGDENWVAVPMGEADAWPAQSDEAMKMY
jgi:hypothetical protein